MRRGLEREGNGGEEGSRDPDLMGTAKSEASDT
jgi:hypothetical protein